MNHGTLLAVLLTTLGLFVTAQEKDFFRCGIRPPQPQLDPWNHPKYGPYGWDNPQIARREDFPWQVAIFRKREGAFRYECGGTLIPAWKADQVLVLTGARCVTTTPNSTEAESQVDNFRVVVGPYSSSLNHNDEEFGAQNFQIRKIEINPSYEVKTHDFDVAVIKLQGDVDFGPLSFPVCLPPSNSESMGVTYNMVGEIAGFGWDGKRSRNFTEDLRYAQYQITQSKTCQSKLGVKVNDYLEFCTSYANDSTACQADYGGGLVFRQPKIRGRYFLQGILSNLDASPITEDGYCENYNVFKRIGPYLEWIHEMRFKLDSYEDTHKLPKPKPTPGFPLHYIVPEYAKIARDLHNHYRTIHKVPYVRLAGKVQSESQRLAEEIIEEDEVELPKEDDYPYGTNVYVIPRFVSAQDAVLEAMQYWYSGFTYYDKNDPKPSPFTQMIWKTSTQIGVGVATNGKKTGVVVNYWPKGNVLYKGGKDYQRVKSYHDNVIVVTSATYRAGQLE